MLWFTKKLPILLTVYLTLLFAYAFAGCKAQSPQGNCKICGVQPEINEKILLHRVINGKKVDILHKYPWMVSISAKDSVGPYGNIMCGGALVSATFVMTAAHCVMTERSMEKGACYPPGDCFKRPDQVNLNLWRNTQPYLRINISRIIVHPSYKLTRIKVHDDIALLQLDSEVVCDGPTAPVCLPHTNLMNIGGSLTIAGWGDSNGEKSDPNKILREGTVKQVPSEECENKGQNVAPAKKIICSIANIESNQTGCYGDSGTAVIWKKDDVCYALGVTSDHSSKTCEPLKQMTYTKVYFYLRWIKRFVKDLPWPPKKEVAV